MEVMTAHHDILDRHDSLRNPFLSSLAVHGALAAVIVIYGSLTASDVVRWGSPNSIGGSTVTVSPVSKIPLPARSGPQNRLANDTQSQVPAPPPEAKPKPKPVPAEEPNAVALQNQEQTRRRTPPPVPSRRTREAPEPPKPNQLYTPGGGALVSPMMGANASGGNIGMGQGSPLGERFGYYTTILQQRIAQAWNTGQVDPRLQTAPMVIVTFEILRDGRLRNDDVRFLQRSGIPALDYSAQRAVIDASPFPPLPPGFDRDSARVEFWFKLSR